MNLFRNKILFSYDISARVRVILTAPRSFQLQDDFATIIINSGTILSYELRFYDAFGFDLRAKPLFSVFVGWMNIYEEL